MSWVMKGARLVIFMHNNRIYVVWNSNHGFPIQYHILFNMFCHNRLGSHSTSDDQSLYQEMDQVEYWTNHLHPVSRLKLYLMNNRGIWDEEKEEEYSQSIDKEIKVGLHELQIIFELYLS